MKTDFAYVAVDDLGKRVSGTAAAANENSLADTLRAQGRYLVEARPASATDWANIRILERITRRDVIFFTSQLATVMSTGVNLVEGLVDIETQIDKAPLKRVIAVLRRDIESGQSLSASLARHPRVFSELYVNIVRAGEATGHADTALDDLIQQLEWQEQLNTRVREVMTYPIIVITMLIALSIVLVGFTIPRFVQIYERLSSDIELPLPTRFVMTTSNIIRGNWFAIIAALLTLFVGLQIYRQTPEGAARFSRFMLRIPILGELIRKVALSRFAHYFGTLHQAGLEVAPSLSLVERLIGNPYLQQRFHLAVDRVMAGDALSKALQRVGEFPPVVIQMISLGERTGRMGKALGDVRVYFDKEIDRSISRSLTLFGPIMLVVLAGVFVTMALAFYLPLFQLLRAVR